MATPPVPEKPYLLGSVTDTSLTIAWEVQSDSRITHYMVFFRTVDEHTGETSCWESFQTQDTQQLEFSSLKPGTSYQFRVASCVGGMQSRPGGISDSIRTSSREIQSQLPAAPTRELHTMMNFDPPPIPLKPTLLGKPGHNRVSLAWDVDGNTSNVTHYTVTYKAVDNDVGDLEFVGSWAKYETKDATKSCIIDKLEPQTSYRFCVSSNTEKGPSPPSPVSNVISTTVDPGSIPISLKLVVDGPVTHDSVPLSWEVTGKSKIVTNYSVFYRKANDEGTHVRFQTDGPQTKYTVRGLDPMTCYQFWVKPHTLRGSGLPSQVCYAATEEYPHRSSDRLQNRPQPPPYTPYDRLQNTPPTLHSGSNWSQSTPPPQHTNALSAGKGSQTRDTYSSHPGATVPMKPELHGQVTESSIPVFWGVSGDTRLVHHYTLSCKRADGAGPLMTYDIDKASTFYRAEGLRAGTPYKFFVTLFTKNGQSQVSEESDAFATCNTPDSSEEILSSAEKPTLAGPVSHNSVPLTWKVIGNKRSVVNYEISYRKCDCQGPLMTVTSPENKHTVEDLDPDTSYTFSVCINYGSSRSLPSELSDVIKTSKAPSAVVQEKTFPSPLEPTLSGEVGQFSVPEKPTLAGWVSHNSVPLTWKVIGNMRSIVNYEISFRKCDSQGPLMTVTTTGPENKHIVEYLDPDTPYTFFVSINYGSSGRSPPSELSDVIKTSKAPSAVVEEKTPPSPLEPTLSGDVGQFFVPLCWRVLGDTTRVTHYTLTYRKTAGESPWMVSETSSPDMQWTIAGLDSETTYEFRVAANTDRGQSLPSKTSEAITTAGAPKSKTPPRPLKPNIKGAATPDSVPLTWKVEGNTTEVTHYTVAYMAIGKQKKNKWITVATDDAEKHFIVEDLEPGTSYIFHVSSNTRRGPSMPSENSDVITTPEQPSGILQKQDGTAPVQTPLKPKLGGAPSHNSIPLVWEADNNMDVTHFTLSYRKTDCQKGIWSIAETQDASKQFTVTDLEPDTSYEFRVAANTKVGQTRPSDVSDAIRTQPDPKYLMQQKLPKPCKLVQVDPPMHNSLTLTWNIDGDSSQVTHYTLTYRAVETEADTSVRGVWSLIETENAESLRITIKGLDPRTTYQCMVAANTKDGQSCKADSAEVFTTAADPEMRTTLQHQPTSDDSKVPGACPIPSKPRLAPDSERTQTTLPVVWEVSAEGTEITHFTLFHKAVDENSWKKVEIYGGKCEYTLQGLHPGQAYFVRIKSHTSTDSSDEGPIGGPFKTESRTENQIYKEFLTTQSELADSDKDMPIYQVPLQLAEKNEAERIQKFEFNKKSALHKEEKVVLMVGATGAGKSTLINGLLNYIVGVDWLDNVRFRLVEESGLFEDQHQSQTRAVTVYTLHHHEVFTIPYTVTVIDTPGFGDTLGIDKDKLITESITHLFSKKEYGIDHIDAIGFVAQSSLARLTKTQMYIFDSILSLFGKDIEKNIFLLITFSDSQKPPVLASTKEAKIPFKSHFKFNNSALFARNDTVDNEFDKMFWKMGAISFNKFLGELARTEGRSLYLTKQVLDERQQLEVYVAGIQIEIRNGLAKLEEYRVEINVVKQHEADIERNKDFVYTVDEIKMKQVDLEPGQNVTNCLTCNRTCHYLCAFANDEDKKRCCAMDPNGFCKICPNNCIWNLHRNVPYRIELETVQVTKTAEDLKARYEKAKGEKMSAEKLTNEILEDFCNLEVKVAYMASEVRRGLVRLSEIALRPNPLSTVQYLELMIRAEETEGKPGFQARIKQLEGVKEQAAILNEMAADGYDPFNEYRETLKNAKDAKDRPSFQNMAQDVIKKNPTLRKKFLDGVKKIFHIKKP